ncbi:MAG: hypothetical protein R3F23_05445 [Verrucomicrobiia bacterium]
MELQLYFLLFGFVLMMLMRWQLAYPGKPLPWFGDWMWLCWVKKCGITYAGWSDVA